MISKLLASAMLAAGLIASASAGAADIVRTQAIVIDDSGTNFFGDKFDKTLQGKTFDDFFTFSLTSANDVNAAVISMRSRAADLNLTAFNLIGDGVNVIGTMLSSDPRSWSLEALNVQPGFYKLEVAGVVDGKGGSFGGNINVVPVPEPETWGMMVAGLGLLGVAATRRKARTDKFSA